MTEYILSPKRRNQQQVSFDFGRQTRTQRKTNRKRKTEPSAYPYL
jgi:hypothetical protein